MQQYFLKLRDLDCKILRISIAYTSVCTEEPDQYSLSAIFRLFCDVAEIGIEHYGVRIIEQQAKENILEEVSLPRISDRFSANQEIAIVIYMTIEFKSEIDKEIFIEDFYSSLEQEF